eukprot:TRINITY_DN24324_c0_g1_i5.p5 TRINITY_DN24324_c0_g1~~TRINITY_DN24324_c0_g1_i5.p5  ORF type:complete len:189 (+),score=-9.39 TRINITY_DN24324_c0_g1_i5:2093-2659(+)
MTLCRQFMQVYSCMVYIQMHLYHAQQTYCFNIYQSIDFILHFILFINIFSFISKNNKINKLILLHTILLLSCARVHDACCFIGTICRIFWWSNEAILGTPFFSSIYVFVQNNISSKQYCKQYFTTITVLLKIQIDPCVEIFQRQGKILKRFEKLTFLLKFAIAKEPSFFQILKCFAAGLEMFHNLQCQ